MKRKKMMALMLCAVLTVSSLAGCGSKEKEPETPAAASQEGQKEEEQKEEGQEPVADAPAGEPVTLVYAISGTPGTPQAEGMYAFEEKLEEISGGLMQVDCYDSSTLFGQNDELQALIGGDIDLGQTSAAWLATDASPWMSMFSMAYLYNSYEHMRAVTDSDIMKEAFSRVSDEQGILPLGGWFIGSRCITLNEERKITCRADMQGVLLRMANTEGWIFVGDALGGSTVPLAFAEIYLGLQTGTVDAQENGLPSMVSNKFYEVQKSMTMTNHVVDCIWPAINMETWNSLSDQQKAWVQEATEYSQQVGDELALKLNEEAVQVVKDAGLTVYDLTEEEVKKYADEVRQYYLDAKDVSGSWDMDLYDQVVNFAY
ncbi:MAG: TRAP transporter substrate-binding protein DctP [Lachnospiraceae bacterium]|nr:TRAP transporter substrate-binding protein DctP [Lachnospiraceae bacterium]